jgi:hypothetical protein
MKKMIFNNMAKRVLSLVLCMVLALGALSLTSCNDTSEDTAGDVDDSKKLVQVLRVIDDVKYGGKFTNDKLETIWVRADAVPEGAISSTEELRGKFAASEIFSGDYVTTAKLLDKRPADAKDEEEEEQEETNYQKLGYVVLSDYKFAEGEKGYGALINRVIAENPGRTIYIPDGEYAIEEPIVIPADPAKSVSLRLGNQTVLRAVASWKDRYVGVVRVGVAEEGDDKILTMDEVDAKNYRSISIIGGCIYGSNVASGITVEGSKDTYIYNVSIKSAVHGIHINKGPNELGATWVNVDNVNVTGSDSKDSVGVYCEGTYNTFANMRIASIMYGTQCTETGERNIFRNLHPLASNAHRERSIGFYDMSDGNNFDVCYSDQFASGYAMHENTRSVMNGGFCYWYSESNNYHVGYKAMGKFNSIIVAGKVAHGHDVATDAYLYIEQEGGQGVVLYPIDSSKSDMHEDMLKQHCPTPIL